MSNITTITQEKTTSMHPMSSEQAASAAMQLSPESEAMLRDMYYPNAPQGVIQLAHMFCMSRGVDHTMKPVYAVNAGGRWSLWPSIHLYRVIASRNMYAGMSKPEYGPTVTVNVRNASITGPEWCTVKIKRILPDGTVAKFFGTAHLSEFAKNTDNWRNMPRHMLTVRAECFALRAGFPEVGGMPTWEEMRDLQSIDDHQETDVIEPPKRIKQDQPAQQIQAAQVQHRPAKDQAKPATITKNMATRILNRFAVKGWPVSLIDDAIGRSPRPDLSDLTVDEWQIAKAALDQLSQMQDQKAEDATVINEPPPPPESTSTLDDHADFIAAMDRSE